jgi:LmbE family N-acetylglucosaminyl deacetylase
MAVAKAQAQQPDINTNAAGAYESLLRLRTTAAVLHTTAHPDDEDGGLITWLARGQGVRTALLTLTRGEGGANLIGSEQFDALGLVRTEELLAAGRYYGIEQFFTRLTDFGFSKRMDETLEHWGKDEVLRDSVRVVRLYRPDIIVSRFHGAARDGHGNHQTAGWMSQEVFKAAADPNRFPEQLSEGLRAWQVKKLYLLVRPNEPATIKIDTGIYDPLIGMSYRQLAARGLSFQRSQGSGGRGAGPGPAISSAVLVASALGDRPAQESSLFDGLDTSLRGLAKLAPSLSLDVPLGEIEKDIARAIEEFDARDPSRVLEPHVVPALRNLRAVIRNVSDAAIDESAKYDLLFRLRNKEDEFMRAGTLLAGVSFEVLTDPKASLAVATPGQKFELTGTFTNRANLKMDNVELGLTVRGGIQFASKPAQRDELGYNEQAKQVFEVTVGDDAEYSRPYWSRKDVFRESRYTLDQAQYANLPYAPPEIIGTAAYRIGGVRFSTTQPALGMGRRPLMIAPAIGISLTPRLGVIPVSRRASSIEVHAQVLSNVAGPADAKVRLELPAGWTATPAENVLHFGHAGEIQNAEFRVSVTQVSAGKSYTVQAISEYGGKQYRDGYEVVAHPDLETRYLYHPALAELTGVDVRVASGLKVAYVMGAGDEVPEALEQLGIKPQMLSATDLANGNLAQFDAILIGLRASAVRPDYKSYNSRLMDYVKNGGNLIVQYQTPEFDEIQYGPYPYKMGQNPEEVSEENSKVTILDPGNPVFAGPNKITAADFGDWVEERGSKFMTTWDPQYKALVECHDRDQETQKGGWLQARYGKGMFNYVAYALYRQLPAGVPGAYRLLANLISLNKSPQVRADSHR